MDNKYDCKKVYEILKKEFSGKIFDIYLKNFDDFLKYDFCTIKKSLPCLITGIRGNFINSDDMYDIIFGYNEKKIYNISLSPEIILKIKRTKTIKTLIKNLLEEYGYKSKQINENNDIISVYNIQLNKNRFLFLFKDNIKNIDEFEWFIKQDEIIKLELNLDNSFSFFGRDIPLDDNMYNILKESLIKQEKIVSYNPFNIEDGEIFYKMKISSFKIKEHIYNETDCKFEDIFKNCIHSKDKNIIENFKIKEKLNRKIFKFKLENNLDLEDTVKRFYIVYDYNFKYFKLIGNTKGLSERHNNISVPIIYFDDENIAKKFTEEVLLPFKKEYPNFRY